MMYRVPSKSEPGQFRIVRFENGIYTCDCPVGKSIRECRHIRLVKKNRGEIQGDALCCFYTHDTRRLEEHHLYRASYRQTSLTVYLTSDIHRVATLNKDFEVHLTDLYFNQYKRNMFKNINAIVEKITTNNSAPDKDIRLILATMDSGAAQMLWVGVDNLFRIKFGSESIYARLVGVSRKTADDEVYLNFEVAPSEVANMAILSALPAQTEIIIDEETMNHD